MEPIIIPQELDDRYPITLDEFCTLTGVPIGMVLDWHERGVGPRWTPFNGLGQLYITVADARRLVQSADFIATWRRGS